jgi:hypothetical protein
MPCIMQKSLSLCAPCGALRTSVLFQTQSPCTNLRLFAGSAFCADQERYAENERE